MGIDHVLQVLRYRTGTMHHQMRFGQAFVDRLDLGHRQDVAIGCTGELISSVRRPTCNRQRVNFGRLNKRSGLVRIGQKLIAVHFAFCT